MTKKDLLQLLAKYDDLIEIKFNVKDYYSRYGVNAELFTKTFLDEEYIGTQSFNGSDDKIGSLSIDIHINKNYEGKSPKISFR